MIRLLDYVILGTCGFIYGSFSRLEECERYAEDLRRLRNLECEVKHKSEVKQPKHV